MTYVYEYVVGNDNVKLEYCHSSISDSIKVVEMWVNGKFHRVTWMSPEGNKALMARLEKDMEDRMCAVSDDAIIEPFMQDITISSDMDENVEEFTSYLDSLQTTGFDSDVDTEVDLDRDLPEFIGHS